MKEIKKCRVIFFSPPKGIGIREVLLTSGCPAAETKCIIGVEECEGPVDCGCKCNTVIK